MNIEPQNPTARPAGIDWKEEGSMLIFWPGIRYRLLQVQQFLLLLGFLLGMFACETDIPQKQLNREKVCGTPGLVAFWDFAHQEAGHWTSYRDSTVIDRSFPVYLRRIGDSIDYTPESWPYNDSLSQLQFDSGGPFGKAVQFNRGYIYGAVPRAVFDNTLLDLHGQQAFTFMAWVKFTGKRHLVAGIWDEGGWQKYSGRRQVALFAGLFGQPGVIAHISATGASSYPQSEVNGSQYARVRAIDGQGFEDHQWVAMAMTYDPDKKEVAAYLNGARTPLALTDPVAQDVFQYNQPQGANPLPFAGPIFSPRAFMVKYNGYSLAADGVSEHRLIIDLSEQSLLYERDGSATSGNYRITFDIQRNGISMLGQSILEEVVAGTKIALPKTLTVQYGDVVHTLLEEFQDNNWRQVGTSIEHPIIEGAPFTFGRALGLASEEIEHGSQLFIDGVAVFNRVLSLKELEGLGFSEIPNLKK